MTKEKSDTKKSTAGFVVGRQAFAAISAVEGLKLSSASEKRLSRLSTSGLTPSERRQAIIQAYSPPKTRG